MFSSTKKIEKAYIFLKFAWIFFSDICTECLNPQVRVNKMANILPPQFLKLTSKAHPLIFLWTRKGFEFPSEFSLNFFSNLYMAPRLRKSFNFMVLGLLKKMHLWVKKIFPSNTLSQLLTIITPGRRKLPISPKQCFLYFYLAERG